MRTRACEKRESGKQPFANLRLKQKMARKCNWLAEKMLITYVMRHARTNKLQLSDPTVHSYVVTIHAALKTRYVLSCNKHDICLHNIQSKISRKRSKIMNFCRGSYQLNNHVIFETFVFETNYNDMFVT